MKFFHTSYNEERVLPFTPPPEKIILPPDGTYPPRLLVMPYSFHSNSGYRSISFWLHNGKNVDLISNKLSVHCLNGYCILKTISLFKEKVLVNGLAFIDNHTLKDGDFVQIGTSWRAIFQADPVQDRRLGLFHENTETEEKEDLIEEPVITEFLRENIVINSNGISFNKGSDFAQWDEIAYIWFSSEAKKFTSHIAVLRDGTYKHLKSNMIKRPLEDASNLDLWMAKAMPFDLTMWRHGYEFAQIYPDAYYSAVMDKIYLPYERGERNLPADEIFIFGIPSRRENILINVSVLAMVLGVMVLLSTGLAIIDNEQGNFLERWIDYTLMMGRLFAIVSGISVIVYLVLMLDYWLKAWSAK